MHDRRLSSATFILCSSAMAAVAAFGTGCGTSAKMSADSTVKAWSSDPYVTPTDDRTKAMNSARVLALPEQPTDRTMQVGSTSALIFERPSVTSKALGMLSVGDAVKVTMEGDFVKIAETGAMREYVGMSGGDTTPSWVKVKSGSVEGWMPARALVSPAEFATSSDSLSPARAGGAKGFSSKVKREAVAMKGAAGTPKVKGANYEAADEIIARLKAPMAFGGSTAAFSPVARVSGVPAVGVGLEAVDPGAAAAVAAAVANANRQPDLGNMDKVSGLLGMVGAKNEDAENIAKATNAAAQFVTIFTEEYPVTAAEERILGRECLAQIVGTGKALPDSHPVAAYVRWVGAKVAANSTSVAPSMGLDFIVLEDEDVNAVAVPGGPIVITTGMLAFLDNEDELAAILGHEVTHVEEQHGLKLAIDKGMKKLPKLLQFCETQAKGEFEPMMAKVLRDAKLPDVVVEKAPRIAVEKLTGEVSKLLEDMVYAIVDGAWKDGDQGVETGADLRGMSLACAAGYDPAALDAVLERLKAMIGSYGGANYSPDRAALERQALPLLPCAHGAKAEKDAAAPAHVVAPSKEAVERWSKMDAELKRK